VSPSEFDLRTALHDGEGDGIDAGAIIAGGQARLAKRRVRIRSGVAVAAVVAVVGVGGSLLFRSGNGGGEGSSTASHGQSGTVNGAARGAPAHLTPSAPRAQADSVPNTACPKSFPHYLLPGGGSPGQFGSSRPLFDKPVSSLLVCSYGSTVRQPSSAPAAVRLTGTQAAAVVRGLEHASKIPMRMNCPLLENTGRTELAMIGFTADGQPIATVTATLTIPPCNVAVTNGTAIRYNWQAPGVVLRAIGNLSRPGGGASLITPSPIGRMHGSPATS
jgi:hypothetical protein